MIALSTQDASAQSLPNGVTPGINPLVDPFAINAKVLLPPPPPHVKLPAVPLPPSPPVLAPAPSFPQGLRAILIRDNGQGLLGSAEAGTFSIPVTNGKPVRIGNQDYHAEVSPTEIKLYSSPRGKLIWEGSLGGSSLVSAPIDLSQVKFIPPLSAGVSPGLKSSLATTGASGQSLSKQSESQ